MNKLKVSNSEQYMKSWVKLLPFWVVEVAAKYYGPKHNILREEDSITSLKQVTNPFPGVYVENSKGEV